MSKHPYFLLIVQNKFCQRTFEFNLLKNNSRKEIQNNTFEDTGCPKKQLNVLNETFQL